MEKRKKLRVINNGKIIPRVVCLRYLGNNPRRKVLLTPASYNIQSTQYKVPITLTYKWSDIIHFFSS